VIEIFDTCPDVDVKPAEYQRLLGYPRDYVVVDRARELVDWARDWYRDRGAPWVYAREVESLDVADDGVRLNDSLFTSPRLARTLRDAGAHSAVLVSVSAGPELESEAQRLWKEGKPDEYFFLEVYGSAVVEHLVTMTGARLCAWAESRKMAVLPHYSPGYIEWSIDEQPALLAAVNRSRGRMPAVPLEVMESGMLRPKKSLLAVFGVTEHVERVQPLSDLIPCENCAFSGCQYRRTAYRRAPRSADPELAAIVGSPVTAAPALVPQAVYTVNKKALQRWSDERLSLTHHRDGSVDATFKYEGTTCTNMGRPLRFQYHVSLGPGAEGYRIRHQHCAPAPGDDGHTYMCRYLSHGDELLTSIEADKPLQGQPLDDVLDWARPGAAAGCYCDADSRQHKWGLVLETIHFALAREQSEQGRE
jgi:hypothetical protein